MNNNNNVINPTFSPPSSPGRGPSNQHHQNQQQQQQQFQQPQQQQFYQTNRNNYFNKIPQQPKLAQKHIEIPSSLKIPPVENNRVEGSFNRRGQLQHEINFSCWDRTVFVVSNSLLSWERGRDLGPLDFFVTGDENAVVIKSKPIKHLESIIDYFRIIFELSQSSKLVMILGDSTSKGLVLNDWSSGNQNVLEIEALLRDRLQQFIDIPTDETMNPETIADQVAMIVVSTWMENLLVESSSSSSSSSSSFLDSESSSPFKNFKMVYALKSFQSDVENSRFVDRLNVKIGEELAKNCSPSFLHQSGCSISIDVVFSDSPSFANNNNNNNNFRHFGSTCLSAQTERSSFIRSWQNKDQDSLWDCLVRICELQHQCTTITVCGIPMKDTSSSKNHASYDIQIICKGKFSDLAQITNALTKAENFEENGSIITTTTTATEHNSNKFNWKRNDTKASTELLSVTVSAHRLTTLKPYTKPTQCLLAYLNAEKPASLVQDSFMRYCKHADTRSAPVTHFMKQHGPFIYIHVLQDAKVFEPRLEPTRKISSKYRTKDFMALVDNHILTAAPPSLTTDIQTSRQQPFSPIYSPGTILRGSNSNGNGEYEGVDKAFRAMATLEHNLSSYRTPVTIERWTRQFPIVVVDGNSEESSLIFNDDRMLSVAGPLHEMIVKPFLAIVRNNEGRIHPDDQKKIKAIIEMLKSSATSNDVRFFTTAELTQNNTARFDFYSKVWGELRMFATKLSQPNLVRQMDHVWPGFNKSMASELRKGKRTNVDVKRDEHGNPILPLYLGALTVLNLGKVVLGKPNYHTEKYIWPVGYHCKRVFTSVKNTEKRCTYTCEIRDGGEAPLFILISEEDPDNVIIEKSATAAWTVVVKQVNAIKSGEAGKRVFTNVSGPEYFGLAHPTVMRLISELPNADKVPRPALPEEFRTAPSFDDDEETMGGASGSGGKRRGDEFGGGGGGHGENYDDDDEEEGAAASKVWSKGQSFLDFVHVKDFNKKAKNFDGRADSSYELYESFYARMRAQVEEQQQQQQQQSQDLTMFDVKTKQEQKQQPLQQQPLQQQPQLANVKKIPGFE